MGNENFDDALRAPELIANVVTDVQESQASLFGAIASCAQKPNKKTALSFNVETEAALDAFSMAIGVIAACDEVPANERAERIAGLCIETECGRLAFLREIAPFGDFQDPETSPEQLTEMAQDYLDRGAEPTEIADEMSASYSRNYFVDIEEFFESVEPSYGVKAKWLAEDIGRQAIEIGKITAAVTVGTVLAHRLLKK
jgi:hypothetical protein